MFLICRFKELLCVILLPVTVTACSPKQSDNYTIRRVRPEYSAPGSWFLLRYNAPVHQAVAVQEFLARKQVCVLNHPPYFPDLSPVIIFCSPD